MRLSLERLLLILILSSLVFFNVLLHLQNRALSNKTKVWKYFLLQRKEFALSEIPPFSLSSLDGTNFNSKGLDSQFTLFVFFPLRGCPPCLDELSVLDELYEEVPRQKLDIIGIACHPYDWEVRTFVESEKITFKILLDKDFAVRKMLNLKSLPFKLLTDSKGKIILVDHRRYNREEQIQFTNFIKELLYL